MTISGHYIGINGVFEEISSCMNNLAKERFDG